MISDDAPDPRNGKIIQCRVLARTLWVPWAGSLAGPWREAPCHYAAGLHHPHQYPIFGASPYNRRRIDKSSCSLRYAALLFRSVRSLLSPEALIVFFDATILRHHSATLPAFVPRIAWIVNCEKIFQTCFSFCPFPSSRSCICQRTFFVTFKHARSWLLTLFKAKYRKGYLKCTQLCKNCICDICMNALGLFVKWCNLCSVLFIVLNYENVIYHAISYRIFVGTFFENDVGK